MLSSDSPSVRPAAEYVGSLLLIVAGLMIVAIGLRSGAAVRRAGVDFDSDVRRALSRPPRSVRPGSDDEIFFLSILSSALLLYGFSFLYGAAGSTRLDHLSGVTCARASARSAAASLPALKLAPIGAAVGLRGHGFPHDVRAVAFLCSRRLSRHEQRQRRLARDAAEDRRLAGAGADRVASMPGMESLGWKVALVMAVLTMTLGNVVALWQDNIRRLLAYSSIAHGGYILIGLSVGLAHDQHAIGGKVFDAAPGGIKLDGVGHGDFLSGRVLPGHDRGVRRAEISWATTSARWMVSTN